MNHHNADNASSSHSEKKSPKKGPGAGAGSRKMTPEDIDEYQQLVDGTSDRLGELCERWAAEVERDEAALGEEATQKAHSAIGKAQLLRTSKFKQFRGFLRDAAEHAVGRPVMLDDVRGFWETIYIQVAEVERRFAELQRLKANDYAPLAEECGDAGGAATVTDGACHQAAKKAPPKKAAAPAAASTKKATASSSLKNFISAQRERKKLNEGLQQLTVEKVPANGHA